ncbi:hypothetical protein ACLMJK_005546 [Lecanora helva]
MGPIPFPFTGDLLPNLIDKRARQTPDVAYAEYPVSTSTYDEGYRRISYYDLANAINGMAHWLVDTLGPGQDFETLPYIGPNDLRYPALIIGAVKAGYKPFVTSPRNSVAAQINLLNRLKCKVLLSAHPRPPAVKAVRKRQNIRVIEVPDVAFLLDTQHRHFPYKKSWPEAQAEPLFLIHTSGSTGMPKPLLYTHATAASNIAMMSLDPPPGYDSQDRIYQGKKVFVTFPPFHAAYLISYLFNAVAFGTVMIAPISGALPSGDNLIEGLKKTSADIAITVPSIIQDLALNPESLDYCAKHLQAILYCGGDLPQTIGDVVASKATLLNQFGASELGLTPMILSQTNRSPGDWKHAQFHPEIGLELRHVQDGVHELYAVRDTNKRDIQPTFTIFPDTQEYASSDLFIRHPSSDKSELWSWQSRADDIIVFLSGEKTNPISMEQHITASHEEITAAIVLGSQRFQAALLIEPKTGSGVRNPAERAAFIERIWSTVEEANKDAPSYARLLKSHVLFTQPQKPMLRTGKGTVQRFATLKLYAREINALYRDADTMFSNIENIQQISQGWNSETASICIRQNVMSIMEWTGLDASADFFGLGMDSLHVLVLVRRLRRTLAMPPIVPSTVYVNPSVSALTNAVLRLREEQRISKDAQDQARMRERNAMIEDYGNVIDKEWQSKSPSISNHGQEIAVLTGSTGNIGSYILDALLRTPNVAHIYCLNRSRDSQAKQMAQSRSLGLQYPSDEQRVSFMRADLSQPLFNLAKAQYDELTSRVTLVIHNAWTVNWNLPLPFFRPQLDGIVNLLTFANQCESPIRLFYVSSISSVMSYRSGCGNTPEIPIATDFTPGANGYGESKYVAEQILEYAASKKSAGIDLAFARVGQVAGAANHSGVWNKNEWFPSLVVSSANLGAIPESLGSAFAFIDWIPIDLLANVLVELALNKSQSMADLTSFETQHAEVFHPANVQTITWAKLRDTITKELEARTQKPVEIVPLRTWINMVCKAAETIASNSDQIDTISLDTALRKIPAAKLLPFFENLVESEHVSINKFETSDTLEMSKSMQNLEPIKDEWIKKWIGEWFAPMTDYFAQRN